MNFANTPSRKESQGSFYLERKWLERAPGACRRGGTRESATHCPARSPRVPHPRPAPSRPHRDHLWLPGPRPPPRHASRGWGWGWGWGWAHPPSAWQPRPEAGPTRGQAGRSPTLQAGLGLPPQPRSPGIGSEWEPGQGPLGMFKLTLHLASVPSGVLH